MRRHFLILSGLLLLAACGYLLPAGHQSTEPAALRAGAYRLDPEHSTILWKVDHLGFSTFVGRFDRLAATLDFDAATPEAAVLDVKVETASVSTHLPGFDETMRGASWLSSEAFPEARFVSRDIEVTGPASGRVQGELTLKGATRPVELEVSFNGGATNFVTGRYTLGFAAAAVVDRSAFDITSLAPAIGREVTLEIHAEFIAVDSKTEAGVGGIPDGALDANRLRRRTSLASPGRRLTSAAVVQEDTR